MLKKKLLPLMIELVVILNHLGVIHLWRLLKFMMATLTYFVTPTSCAPPLHLQKWTIHLLFKTKESADMRQILRPHRAVSFSCGHHKCMVPYIFAVYEFSALEKVIILLFEGNKLIIKIFLKEIYKTQKCGSPVKVNDISDGILWYNFMW